MTMSFEVSTASNVNMELNMVSSDKEFFISIFHRHKFGIDRAVKHQSLSHLNLLHDRRLHNWSRSDNFDLSYLYWSSHWSWLNLNEEKSLFLTGGESHHSVVKFRPAHFNHHSSHITSLLRSDKYMLVDVLESISTSLIKPNLEMCWMRKKTCIISAMTINVESAHHTKFESFIEDMNIRKTERSPVRILTVDKNKSLCGKNKMSFTSKVTSSINMNMELNEVSSKNKFFIHISNRHELCI
mmetsp:Transcript_61904/g.85342  ORF Transcript_61904/g.85342 Transcript_61904/m.85342 type:complete len:241 (+) Transcript_61904:1324-2046(+)